MEVALLDHVPTLPWPNGQPRSAGVTEAAETCSLKDTPQPERLPWELHPTLTEDRLRVCAQVLAIRDATRWRWPPRLGGLGPPKRPGLRRGHAQGQLITHKLPHLPMPTS
jgi:hypothetical protein